MAAFPIYYTRSLPFSPLSLLLPRTAQPVGTIPRTPTTEKHKHMTKSSIFVSNLISSPFLNFFVTDTDRVDNKKRTEQIRDK